MTDKELIKQEIERLKNEQLSIFSKGESVEICGTALDYIGIYNQLLSFIDSLPEEPTVKGITWEDVNTLDILINEVRHEFPNGISEKSFGLAVLEKFQDCQLDMIPWKRP